MKTRGKGSKGSTKPADIPVSTPQNSAPKVQLGPESNNPPQLFILPKDASTDARIVSLTNPRNLAKTRYLVCPEYGVYEFTRVAAPKTLPRSLLLTPPCLDSLQPTPSLNNELSTDDIESKDDAESSSKGYVLRTADLFIATPIDPLFLMLPVLSPTPSSKGSEPTKRLFLSGDDYFDNLISTSPQLGGLMKSGSLRSKLEARMAAVCDTVEAGDETMYRLSEEKLLSEMVQKVTKMIQAGLPPSMEEKLVRKALEVPMLSIKREDSSMHELAKEEDESGSASFVQTPDTQSSTKSTETAGSSVLEVSTAVTSLSESLSTVNESTESTKSIVTLPPINAPDGIAHLLRFRTALLFICSSYLAPHISELLKNLLTSPTSTVDFGPLDAHLTHLTKLRQDALAARSLGDFSRKRALDEDAESGETRADKKRKKEEEEKRKRVGESRGVKNLKKVDVSGMKKMTSFFTKK